ncbi:MAG: metal ABC transporter permease [Firmicutes bacterium]|nr:metal ABC transporter permease [Bacillota bacterium]
MMDYYYSFIDQVLPFAWAHHEFMKNALLAVLMVTPLFGITGTMIVNNRMAFFSDAIGHSALTGIAIGVLLGFTDPLWAMIVFSVLLALAISYIKTRTTTSTDTLIGVFSSTAVALGIVILSRGGGFNRYSRFLIGDLLSITPGELGLLALVLAGIAAFWIFGFNRLLMVSLSPSLALSRGIDVRWWEIGFSVLMAVMVTVSIQWVGIMIINSLLVLPAAAARNVSIGMRRYHLVSVLLALGSGLAGLILSYYWGTATGATIVLVTALLYLASLVKRLWSD